MLNIIMYLTVESIFSFRLMCCESQTTSIFSGLFTIVEAAKADNNFRGYAANEAEFTIKHAFATAAVQIDEVELSAFSA